MVGQRCVDVGSSVRKPFRSSEPLPSHRAVRSSIPRLRPSAATLPRPAKPCTPHRCTMGPRVYSKRRGHGSRSPDRPRPRQKERERERQRALSPPGTPPHPRPQSQGEVSRRGSAGRLLGPALRRAGARAAPRSPGRSAQFLGAPAAPASFSVCIHRRGGGFSGRTPRA